VADASVLINLHATGVDAELLRHIEHPFVVSENARIEMERGNRFGHGDAEHLSELVSAGLVNVTHVSPSADEIYEALVSGPGCTTLDDGEAATLAIADDVSGIALIEEQKAIRIAAERFPRLEVVSTVEILLHSFTLQLLGSEGQAAAVFRALKQARMRVHPSHIEPVASLLTADQLAQCYSLPRHVRERYQSGRDDG
jgi:predicted nucleic acid-binding protein